MRITLNAENAMILAKTAMGLRGRNVIAVRIARVGTRWELIPLQDATSSVAQEWFLFRMMFIKGAIPVIRTVRSVSERRKVARSVMTGTDW